MVRRQRVRHLVVAVYRHHYLGRRYLATSTCKAAFVEVELQKPISARDDLHPLKAFTNTFASLQAEIEAKAPLPQGRRQEAAFPLARLKKFANSEGGQQGELRGGGGSKRQRRSRQQRLGSCA